MDSLLSIGYIFMSSIPIANRSSEHWAICKYILLIFIFSSYTAGQCRQIVYLCGVIPWWGSNPDVCWCNPRDHSSSPGSSQRCTYKWCFLKPYFTWPLSIIYDTQFHTKKCTYKLMKALLIHRFRNILLMYKDNTLD